MRWSGWVGVAALVWLGCGRRSTIEFRSDPPFMPVASDEQLDVGPPDPEVDRFAAELAAAATAGDRAEIARLIPHSIRFGEWLNGQPADARFETEVVGRAHLPGGSRIALLVTATSGHRQPETFTVTARVGPGSDHAEAPVVDDTVEAAARDQRVTGDLVIDAGLPWIAADLELTIDPAPEAPFEIRLPGADLRVAVDQDGQPAKLVRFAETLVVEPQAGRAGRFRLRFEGSAVGYGWILGVDGEPAVASTVATSTPMRVDVRVHHRDRTTIHASQPARPEQRRFAGWKTSRVEGSTRELTVWVMPERDLRRATVTVGVGTVELAAPPGQLDAARATVEHALTALAPLGPLPVSPRLTVVPGLPLSRVAGDAIVVTVRPTADEIERLNVFTHELAHLWFPGVVPARPGVAARWSETVAEYVSTWALTDEQARSLRVMWLHDVQRLALAHERPAAWAGGLPDEDCETLSYARGALVLAGLEARVGRPAMARWLRQVIEHRRGTITGLDELAASAGPVLGAAHAEWLASWLTATAPATIVADHVSIAGGRLRADLVVDAPSLDGVELDVTMADTDGPIASHRIALTGRVTPIDLPIPDGTTGALLGGGATLPLHGVGSRSELGLGMMDMTVEIERNKQTAWDRWGDSRGWRL